MPKGSSEGKIAGAASVIGSATVLSRVLGYARDASVAFVFGAAMQTDAFFVAFRISNLLRRLLGEGALTSSFVPIFTEELTLRGKDEARRFASSTFTLFAIILVALTFLGILAAPWIVAVMSPGFLDDPEKFGLTVRLTRVMFPYMITVGLMAIAMGVLNSLKRFGAPAVSPVFFNLSMIGSVFALTPIMPEPVYALPAGVLLGGILQFLVHLPFLGREGFMPAPSFSFALPGIKRVLLLLGPAAFGVGVYQLNIFVTMWFASRLAEGSISYLYYASRLMELPLGVFGVAVSTAVLPSLSEHAARGEREEFRRSLSFAVRLVVFVTLPAMAGLLVLNRPIIDVLFMRGEFGSEAAAGTAYALYFYALGLIPVSLSRVLVSVYYSMKDTATPVYTGVAAFVSNVILCYLLVGPLGHGGLALATSISSAVNLVGLFVMLKLRLGRLGSREMMLSGVKALAASAAMAGIIYLLGLEASPEGAGLWAKAAYLAVAIVVGVAAYLVMARLFRAHELTFLKGFLRKG